METVQRRRLPAAPAAGGRSQPSPTGPPTLPRPCLRGEGSHGQGQDDSCGEEIRRCTMGHHDLFQRPGLRSPRRPVLSPPSAPGRGLRHHRQRHPVRGLRRPDPHQVPDTRLRPVRSRLRLRQRPHHQYRRLRYARLPASVAASLASAFRQTGNALGVAVVGAVLASRIDPGAYADTYPTASHPAWWIIAGCSLTVLVVGQLTATGSAQRNGLPDAPTARTAHPRRPESDNAPEGVWRAKGRWAWRAANYR